MSLPEEAGAQNTEHDALFAQEASTSMSRLRVNALASDVRALTNQTETGEGEQADLGAKQALLPPPLGMLRILDALESYNDSLPLDSGFWAALRSGDSAQVMNWLLRENIRLRKEITSAEEDFDGLRSMNVNIQEQLTVALAAADDVRLDLAMELERAKDRIIELELRLRDTLAQLDRDADDALLVCDGLMSEIIDLRGQLKGQ